MEDDVTKDLAEFSLANAIYAALVESHACEQSARYVFLRQSFVSIHSTLSLAQS
jgi:F0F1-type ATP synthase gamma subunit